MSESKSASVVFTNGSLLAKNAQASADSARNAADNAFSLANGAQRTADGKNSVYRGSDPSTVPTAGLKAGDIFFSDNAVYTWTGSAWEKTVSDTTGADISAKVDQAQKENQQSVADLKASVESKAKELDETKEAADNLVAYVKGSKGSTTLETLLSMDPTSSTIAQVVNGKPIAAINMSSEGDIIIDGSKLHITALTTIDDASIKSAKIASLSADKITTGTLDASKITVKNLTADNIASGTLKGMTITGSQFVSSSSNIQLPNDDFWTNYRVVMDSDGMTITGQYDNETSPSNHVYTNTTAYILGNRFYQDMTTNDWTRVIDINTKGENPSLELTQSWNGGGTAYTYVGSDMIWSNQVKANEGWFGNIKTVGNKAFVLSGNTFQITNSVGQNNNEGGTVGLSIWGGLGFGKQTIYTQTGDIYFQKGDPNTGALTTSYSSATKAILHAQKVVSQVANTVSSRLSVKTDITPVTYDRALAAVEGTEMYDYRYISDNSGQHYVSGIIDDVNPDPQYHMDDMLINKERTARIDANLVGYHHVVLQEILKRLDKLEAKEQ